MYNPAIKKYSIKFLFSGYILNRNE